MCVYMFNNASEHVNVVLSRRECSGWQQSAILPQVHSDSGYSCHLSSLDAANYQEKAKK